HVRGAGDAGRTGRTRRGGKTAGIETEEQRIPLAARESEMGVGRQTVRSARAGEHGTVDARFDSRDEAVTQRRQSCRPGLEVGRDEVDGGGEGHGTGDVEGARAHAALLSPAVEDRSRGRPTVE